MRGFQTRGLASAAAFAAGIVLGCSSDDSSSSGSVKDCSEQLTDAGCMQRHDADGNAVGETAEACKNASKHGDEIAHEWIRRFDITLPAGQSFSKITAKYTVPEDPKLRCDQTLYYFVGFQNANDSSGLTVVQPVLGWWEQEDGWFLTSEDCCDPSNRTSNRIRVNAGDVIDASVVVADDGGITITTSRGSDTTVLTGSTNGRHFNQAVAALEVYRLEYCGEGSELPKIVDFEIVELLDGNGNPVTQAWNKGAAVDDCEADISVTNVPAG